ncbi:hypothetical protein CVT25_014962 [Psilocybe cyanescens]|uniref:Major facilitator superfamily (MFS) profile domain-containing protein n=1 Tax=Psilocybe cyanescens TaxID=93625 RepID=A0A409XI62_PSICY|nr:hypothetical protein CVT25_014962 [Psilocybe cyanescens]
MPIGYPSKGSKLSGSHGWKDGVFAVAVESVSLVTESYGVPTSFEMSLRLSQSGVLKTQENPQPRGELNCGDSEVKEPLSSTIDSTAAVVVPKVAYLPYTHSTKDVSDAPSPSPSLPPIVAEDGIASITTHYSGEATANNVILERLRWRLSSGFFAYFMCGWGDGVTGAVLPYFMADYHIGFMMSSLLYAATTVGFMVGTCLVESIVNQLGCFDLTSNHSSWIPRLSFSCLSIRKPGNNKIGYSPSQARHVALLVSSILHGMFFVMMGSRGGFWVVFGAYAVAAFARSILTGPQQSLGYAFGLWSLGGVASPLLCQSLIAINVPWFKFYLGSLVLSAINVAMLVSTFKPTEREFMRDRQNAIILASKYESETSWSKDISSLKDIECMPTSHSQSEKIATNTKGMPSSMQRIMGTDRRNANPKTVGYVSSGFWGGITIGRFVWGHLTPKLDHAQRKYVIQICMYVLKCRLPCYLEANLPYWQPTNAQVNVRCAYRAVIGLTMQVLIWTVDSNLANSISTSVIGLVYGPVFPASLTLANDILSLEVRMISMALISASASFGSALFPFIAGTVSSLEGVRTLPYITVPLAATLACFWALFPSKLSSRPGDVA